MFGLSSVDWMERGVPWGALVDLIAPYAPEGRRGRPPFAVETILRIHFMQQRFTLSEPAIEEALLDMALFRDFAGLNWDTRLPDETTRRRFFASATCWMSTSWHRRSWPWATSYFAPRACCCATAWCVDATLIAAPSPTKNASGERDPQREQSQKGNQWYFGMKAHIGVDAESGLVHKVRGTTGSVNDVVEADALLHGEKAEAWGDAGYQGAAKRPDARDGVRWNIAMRQGKRRQLDKTKRVEQLIDPLERIEASIRAKVEQPFRVDKRQFGHVRVRYCGMKKKTAQLQTLFALSNL